MAGRLRFERLLADLHDADGRRRFPRRQHRDHPGRRASPPKPPERTPETTPKNPPNQRPVRRASSPGGSLPAGQDARRAGPGRSRAARTAGHSAATTASSTMPHDDGEEQERRQVGVVEHPGVARHGSPGHPADRRHPAAPRRERHRRRGQGGREHRRRELAPAEAQGPQGRHLRAAAGARRPPADGRGPRPPARRGRGQEREGGLAARRDRRRRRPAPPSTASTSGAYSA